MADRRASILLKRGPSDPLLSGPLLDPLKTFGGVVFPYTPQITYQVQAEWSPFNLVHTNYQPQIYARTKNPSISITNATFTATTEDDARYMFAVTHFFKTVTKMSFGVKDPNRGSPPPVLHFSAYGDAAFRDVPVVITDFNMIYDNQVDYVKFSVGGSEVNMPIKMDITLNLMVNMPMNDVKNNFTLKDFANGNLVKQKKGYI